MARYALLSDSRHPTHPDFAGHGLGRAVLTVANGLAERGHAVTLYAAPGSKFDAGELITGDDERAWTPVGFDAVLDSTHEHTLQKRVRPDAPIVNWSHDRENLPGKNAIFPSNAHREFHDYTPTNGRVIYNAVDIPELPDVPQGDYYAYLSSFYQPKAPLMAWNAARLAGVKLVMAGPTPPAPPPGCEYIGPVWGEDKINFLAGAKALLFGASIEAGPLTPLEAQALGCPVIVSAYGAASENMLDLVGGYVVRDTLEMVDAINKIESATEERRLYMRREARQWIVGHRSVKRMVDGFEQALLDVSRGVSW